MSHSTIDLVERPAGRTGVRPRDAVLTAVVVVLLVASFALGRATIGRATSSSPAHPAPAPRPSATAAAQGAPDPAAGPARAFHEAPQNDREAQQQLAVTPQTFRTATQSGRDARQHGVQVRCVAHKPC
jgi:hypothetical protein